MKLLNAHQIVQWEQQAAQRENESLKTYMNTAARLFANWIDKKLLRDNMRIAILCGPGNNGGDGYTIGRILHERNEQVDVFELFEATSELCKDAKQSYPKEIYRVQSLEDLSSLDSYHIVVDALFGIGINKAFAEDFYPFIDYINTHSKCLLSVDIPSGMFPDEPTEHKTIEAHETLSFSQPKTAFFQAANAHRVGKWVMRDISIPTVHKQQFISNTIYVDRKYIQGRIKERAVFSHKGNYGHAVVVGGNHNMAGSILLSAKAAIRVGAGLVTIGSVETHRAIYPTALPEAMFQSCGKQSIVNIPVHSEDYYFGIGPGMGHNYDTAEALIKCMSKTNQAMVLDADALSIIADKQLLKNINKNSILTPHPKEFDRIFGDHISDYERRKTQVEQSVEHGLYIILKGAYTTLSCPAGKIYYNSTGNPGMATAGSGDVLLGMLTGFMAQGYTPLESSLISVYMHGLAGDLAAKELGQNFMIASDIIQYFPQVFNMIK